MCLVCTLAVVASAQNSDKQNTPVSPNQQQNQPLDQSNQNNQGDLDNNQSKQSDNELNLRPDSGDKATPVSPELLYDQKEPSTTTPDSQSDISSPRPQPFDPLDFFQPRPRPRPSPFGSQIFPPLFHHFLGQDMSDFINRRQEQMNQQFKQLERQAAQGIEVSRFSKDGVTYERTCTTKRVM